MKTIEPTYVTFEQAERLNEKRKNCIEHDRCEQYLMQPEQWQVVEWLRVNHDIHVTYDVGMTGYYGLIKYREAEKLLYLSKWINEQENPLRSPQEAYSAAFDYIFNNNLIK